MAFPPGVVISLPNGSKIMAFFTLRYSLSNHYPARLFHRNVEYNCSEQFYMAERARFFNNNDVLKAIMAETDPRKIKRLGTEMPEMKFSSNRDKWHGRRELVMATALILKFTQDPLFNLELQHTHPYFLVEASRHDSFWGAGKTIGEMRDGNLQLRGLNMLGNLLVALRELIIEGRFVSQPWTNSTSSQNPDLEIMLHHAASDVIRRAYDTHRRGIELVFSQTPPPWNSLKMSTPAEPRFMSEISEGENSFARIRLGSRSRSPIRQNGGDRPRIRAPSNSPSRMSRTSRARASTRTFQRSHPANAEAMWLHAERPSYATGCDSTRDLRAQFPVNRSYGERYETFFLRKSNKSIDFAKYMVVQIEEFPNMAIAALTNARNRMFGYPWTMSIVRNCPGSENKINIGDSVWCELESLETCRFSGFDIIFSEFKVNPMAHARSLRDHETVALRSVLGIVVRRSRPKRHDHGRIIVNIFNCPIPLRVSPHQAVGFESYEKIKIGTVVDARVFTLPQSSRVSEFYWLPQNFTDTGHNEISVHAGEFISSVAPCGVELETLLLPITSYENAKKAQEAISLAIKVYTETLVELSESTAVTGRLYKVESERDENGEIKHNKLWIVYCAWEKLQEVVEFGRIWRKDVKICAYDHPKAKLPCGSGTIVQVLHIKDYRFKVIISLSEVERKGENSDAWDSITEPDEEHQYPATLKIIPHVSRLQARAERWRGSGNHEGGAPDFIAKRNTNQGRIVASLMGLPHENPLIANVDCELTLDEEDKMLNEGQQQTFKYMLTDHPSIVVQDAPPGAGKTEAALMAIKRILRSNPDDVVVLASHSNLSVKRLAEGVVPSLPGEKKLIILSGPAKEEYATDFSPYKDHFLVVTVEQFLEEFVDNNDKGQPKLDKYVDNCQQRPRLADDKGAVKVLVGHDVKLPRVIFATMAMLEDIPLLCSNVTVLVVDEAGQSDIGQLVPIVCEMPKLKKLLLTGDERQSLNYVEDIPEHVRPFGSESLLTYVSKLNRNEICRVSLKLSYRFHPELALCIAATGYGNSLIPAVEPHERPLMTSGVIPLPNREVPILMLHQDDVDKRAPRMFSRCNEGQTEIALEILREMVRRFPSDTSIVVLCLYTAEKQIMREKLRDWSNIRVLTADSFQANQADIIYLVTTRSPENNDATEGSALDFIKNDRRATVAISRARHGMVLQGNLNVLSEGKVWRAFMKTALEKTFVVSPREYKEAMLHKTPLFAKCLPALTGTSSWGTKNKNGAESSVSESDPWEHMTRLSL